MTENDSGFKQRMEELGRYVERISQKPLEKRVAELKRLKGRKKELGVEVEDVDIKAMVLENMPDVARYRMEHDEMAMSLLQELKEREGKKGERISYRNLTESYDRVGQEITIFCLNLLERAELITTYHSTTFGDDLIQLTEMGRTFQYNE